MILNIFKSPSNSNYDYYQQSKFRLTWYLQLTITILFSVLITVFSVIEPKFVIYYSIGFVSLVLSLLLMKKTGEYRISAMFISIMGFGINTTSFFLIGDAPHLVESFWLVNIAMYAYFVLGPKWGNILLFIQVAVTGSYMAFFLKGNLTKLSILNDFNYTVMALELTTTMIILSIIVNKIVRSHNYATQEFKNANGELMREKEVVESQNKEKTVLLQEIHHRVKNNLQVIVSLLRLQSNKIESEEAKENFNDAINRILTMSLIHQKMYQGDNLSGIDLKDYFNSLVADLLRSTSLDLNIELESNINVEKIGNKTVIPLALIVTELVTNSIKHAFTTSKTGKIYLLIEKLNNKKFIMIYSDNGTWKSKSSKETMGNDLIEALTEQLEGKMNLEILDDTTQYSFELSILNQE